MATGSYPTETGINSTGPTHSPMPSKTARKMWLPSLWIPGAPCPRKSEWSGRITSSIWGHFLDTTAGGTPSSPWCCCSPAKNTWASRQFIQPKTFTTCSTQLSRLWPKALLLRSWPSTTGTKCIDISTSGLWLTCAPTSLWANDIWFKVLYLIKWIKFKSPKYQVSLHNLNTMIREQPDCNDCEEITPRKNYASEGTVEEEEPNCMMNMGQEMEWENNERQNFTKVEKS